MDSTVDPPPDLAIAIDITSRTHPDTYATLGVPELWQRAGGEIRVYQLQAGRYVAVAESPSFSGWPLHTEIPRYVELSRIEGRNQAMRSFRQWVRERLGSLPPSAERSLGKP